MIVDNNTKARVVGIITGGQPKSPPLHAAIAALPPDHAALRAVGRPDMLTAQKVEVGIVFQAMLGTPEAARYFAANDIPVTIALRVLTQPALRRTGAAAS